MIEGRGASTTAGVADGAPDGLGLNDAEVEWAPARRSRSVLGYVVSRLAQGVVVLVGAVLISFALAHLTGDPATVLAGGSLPAEQVAVLSHKLGYDKPLAHQFTSYVVGVSHGDFGESYRANGPALGAVTHVLSRSLILVVGALLVACAIAIPVSVFSVLHRESLADRAIRRLLIVGQGMPEFWLGLVLILVFAVKLDWLPTINDGTPRSWVLPVVTLALPLSAVLVRILRSGLLDVMGADYITALRARGLSERAIVLRHGLRNAQIPFIAFLALQVGWLFGGTVIVETVFVFNGVGSLLLTSVQTRDLPVVQAIVVLIAAAFVVMNLIADLLALVIDPRLRAGRFGR